eukprot:gene5967-6911_t
MFIKKVFKRGGDGGDGKGSHHGRSLNSSGDDIENYDDIDLNATEPPEDKKLWSKISSYVGKDTMSLVSLPVYFFEPITVIQSQVEPLRFVHLIEKACDLDSSIERMALITAFNIAIFSSYVRTAKPFNPLLGETFEPQVTGSIYSKSLGSPQSSGAILSISGDKANVTFHKSGWFDGSTRKISGEITDAQGRKRYLVSGKWNECVIMTKLDEHGTKCDEFTIWKHETDPQEKINKWKLGSFIQSLNEMSPEYESILPPTDSRLRSDRRNLQMENNKMANREKNRIEEQQRALRREREMTGEKWTPVYFKKVDDPQFGYRWLFNGAYWNERTKRMQHHDELRINKGLNAMTMTDESSLTFTPDTEYSSVSSSSRGTFSSDKSSYSTHSSYSSSNPSSASKHPSSSYHDSSLPHPSPVDLLNLLNNIQHPCYAHHTSPSLCQLTESQEIANKTEYVVISNRPRFNGGAKITVLEPLLKRKVALSRKIFHLRQIPHKRVA